MSRITVRASVEMGEPDGTEIEVTISAERPESPAITTASGTAVISPEPEQRAMAEALMHALVSGLGAALRAAPTGTTS